MDALLDLYRTWWMFRSNAMQELAWEDAREMRLARTRADYQAAVRAQEMLDAHPSGALGKAVLNDIDALERGGLL